MNKVKQAWKAKVTQPVGSVLEPWHQERDIVTDKIDVSGGSGNDVNFYVTDLMATLSCAMIERRTQVFPLLQQNQEHILFISITHSP